MKRKVPPEKLAKVLGVSVGHVEECLKETAIQMLEIFNVSWEGRDPVEAFDEYLDSAVETLVLARDPDRKAMNSIQKAIELEDDKQWLCLDFDGNKPYRLTVPWSLVGKNAKPAKLVKFIKMRERLYPESIELCLISRLHIEEIEAGSEPDYDPTLADLLGRDIGGSMFLPEDLWIDPDLEACHPCIRVSVSKLLDLK